MALFINAWKYRSEKPAPYLYTGRDSHCSRSTIASSPPSRTRSRPRYNIDIDTNVDIETDTDTDTDTYSFVSMDGQIHS